MYVCMLNTSVEMTWKESTPKRRESEGKSVKRQKLSLLNLMIKKNLKLKAHILTSAVVCVHSTNQPASNECVDDVFVNFVVGKLVKCLKYENHAEPCVASQIRSEK